MSTFYATIEGNRGPATRCGSEQSGIRASTQSYDGSVIVELDYDSERHLIVDIGTANGSSAYASLSGPHWRGTFDEFKELLEFGMECKRHQ